MLHIQPKKKEYKTIGN